jgi:8-oxo-dGTP diphosphatase
VTTKATVAVAAAVFNHRGDVLLIQRDREPGAGLWTLPGGKLEAFEKIIDGVAREIREETGIAVEVGPNVAILERMAQPSAQQQNPYHYVILDYVARAVELDAQPRASDDARDAAFVPVGLVDTYCTTDGLLAVIHAAQQRAVQLGWISEHQS